MIVEPAYKILRYLSEQSAHHNALRLGCRVDDDTATKYLRDFTKRGLLEIKVGINENNRAVRLYHTTEKGYHVMKALELLA